MAGTLTQDKIKNVYHKLVFLEGDKLYTTASGGATDVALPGLKLDDEISVTYGTHNDFKMYYSDSSDSLVLKSASTISGSSFFTVNNYNTKVFGINPNGVLNLTTVTAVDNPNNSGDMKFAGNELYIAKD